MFIHTHVSIFLIEIPPAALHGKALSQFEAPESLYAPTSSFGAMLSKPSIQWLTIQCPTAEHALFQA